ncbi:hypothetical protein Bca4012_098529 [Brassica carinata]|uniref:Uncharacterized protein n=1 Tax=Brassica carinata TaxID=52824 RepID=A0A8X7PHJ8_BRACI|nr:hypothetical protein Bca52824_081198 [Brassica carinata]
MGKKLLEVMMKKDTILYIADKRKEEIMAGKHGRKKSTQKKSENSTRARENVAPVVEEHVEEQSDGNNSDDLSPDLCQPSEEIKGRKRKNPSSISGGVSTRTRARKAVSDGNEPVGEDVVHEESTRVREKTAVSLSLDSESEDMSAVSSKWVNMDCGRPEGLDKTAAEENYDRAKRKDKDTGKEVQEKQQPREDGEKEAEEEQEKRVQDGEKEGEKEPKETPTPPRGRTKAAAARKLVHSSPEKFFQFARPSEEEELTRLKERCAVQAEKLWRKIEEEEEILESPDEEELEKPQENTEKVMRILWRVLLRKK